MPETRALNDYVQTGKGDPRAPWYWLKYWPLNTEEMLAFVEWMRGYNASGRGHRLQLVGFEVSKPDLPTDVVREFCAAWIRTENVSQFAQLWCRADSGSAMVAFANMERQPAKGSQEAETPLPHVRDILIARVDGLKGFPDAIENLYPQTQVQLCIVHLVRNSLRYVSWKERKAIALALRAIYAAPTAEAAEQALEAFAQRWDRRFPPISKSWREHWQRMIPFFAYPPEIRKVICTTNAIESINASLRKVTRKRGAFSNPDSVGML